MKKNAMLALTSLVMLISATVAAATAPPLSYVQVRYVGSSNQGWEPIADAQASTTLDHGGAQLRVPTVEVGYDTPSASRRSTAPRCRPRRTTRRSTFAAATS